MRSPTTTGPVAMPTRAWSLTDIDIEATDGVDHPQPGADRALGVVLMRSR